MKSALKLATAAAALIFALPTFADEKYEHFKGEPSKTLAQAVANFSEYNNRLEQVLAGVLTPEAMNEGHQRTYTLENALGKLEDELVAMAERLEKVHRASERAEATTVKHEDKVY